MILTFLDTETTDIEDGRLVELAFADQIDGEVWGNMHPIVEFRCRPPVSISVEAMSTHHITESDVINLPYCVDHPDYPGIKAKLEESLVVAHRAPFDLEVLEREGIIPAGSIDTRRVAMHLWPELPKYKLQYLRYALKLDMPAERITPHEARSDVIVLGALFRRIMLTIEGGLMEGDTALDKAIELSTAPVLVRYCDFKKHKGETWEEIARTDRDYLVFFLGKDDIDDDLKYTVRYWLDQPIRV